MAPNNIGWHVNDRNRDIADAFLAKTEELGLTNSRALEYAARLWLESHGVWIFDPVGPDRQVLITPTQPGDFEPFHVPAGLRVHVDRYVTPPRVIVPEEGIDYVVPVVDQ